MDTDSTPDHHSARAQAALRKLADSANMIIWMTDADDVFIYLNESASALFEKSEAFSLSSWFQFLHSDDRMRIAPIVGAAKRTRTEYQVEYRIIRSDGSIRWMMSSAAPRFSDDGEFLGFNGTVVDVSDRHHALERLAKSEAGHRLLTENTSDLISHHAPDGTLLYVSPSIKRVLGFEPSELVGTSLFEHVHPDDMDVIRDEIRRQVKGGSEGGLIEFRKRHKDGHYLWMGTKARVLVDPVTKEKIGTVAVSRDVTESYATRAELHQSKNRLFSILESIGDAFFAIDRDWRITYANRKTAEFVGHAQDALIGNILWEAVPEIRSSPIFKYYQTAMEMRTQAFFEAFYEPARAWVEVRVYPFEDGLSVYFHDITARREAESAIRNNELRLRELIEMTPAGYVLIDAHGTLIDVNPALCRISGYAQEELIGRSMMRLFPDSPYNDALFAQGGALSIHGTEVAIKHKNGDLVYVLINANIKRDAEGRSLSVTAFVTDITERKQSEARLEQLATHDMLTGLPNRALLNDRLQHMLDCAPPETSIAVMFIDLDRFKEVNDSMGHEPGDILLREVGRRLQKNLRQNDIVARLGGDEFVVVAHCSKGAESATRVVQKLFSALAAPVDIAGQEVFVGASIGISMFPQDGDTKERLFQNADTAMYRAKAAGRNGYRFFEAEMSGEAKTRMTLEHALRRALERNEFELHYQPRIALKTMAIVGMEALIRWNHPQLGEVSPLQFVAIAEERGLIEPIGRWVLQEACAQTRRLMEKFNRSLRVSVNLSARQLKCDGLTAQVGTILKEVGLPPHLLELELTESALIEDIEVSAGVLKELKKLGISLSVDDFGTGYSGLAYLRRFPLDTLKLDRSFVSPQGDDVSSFRFIKAFVDLAHALNLSVVAEGVETNDTLQFLRDAACDEAQGYLLARPLPLDAFEAFLSRLPAPEKTKAV
jgi:diguanylate cyclase (GGDEF)-like protein/PAS domain S-box-containing protein